LASVHFSREIAALFLPLHLFPAASAAVFWVDGNPPHGFRETIPAANFVAMSTAATFRKLALALSGAIESAHMGHPDFRVGGRIFASLSPDAATGNVKLTPEQQEAMLAAEPDSFRPAAGAWGRSGWTTAILADATRPVLAAVLEMAHENVASQPASKAAQKSAPRSAAKEKSAPRGRRG
jgi:hypothetical protein